MSAAKRTCTQLGVCQSRTPACSQCTGCVPHGDPADDTDYDPERPDGDGNWDTIAGYLATAIATLMTVAFFGVTAGYVYANWVA
jgi:hypothetical protein